MKRVLGFGLLFFFVSSAFAIDKRVELGKQLFFDPRLSVDGSISCNSCHNVMLGGEDNRAHSMGVKGQLGGRSAPTVWNAKFMSVMFWDGRAKTLEEQAKGPLTNPVEMAMPNHDAVVARVAKIPGYKASFKSIYGNKPITIDHIAESIAAFERTLVAMDSPYDQYKKGKQNALNDIQKRGLAKFESTGCVACHSGENFAGPSLAQGNGFFMKFPLFEDATYTKKYDLKGDTGKHQVSKNESDKHFWRVPTLRNIALTAPYFHNGKVENLPEAIRVMAKVQLNKDLSNTDVEEIEAFLKSLTGKRPSIVAPQLPVSEGVAF